MATLTHSRCLDPHWAGRADCRHCKIRALMPFAPLEAEDLDQILLPVEDFRVPEGVSLFESGMPAAAVFALRRGYVKLVETLADGRPRILRLLRAGDLAGLESLVGDAYRHTAITLTPANLCEIPAAVVLQLAERRPAFQRVLFERWQESLDQADRLITRLTSGDALGRVARLLLYLDELGQDGQVPRLSRQDMAAILDLSAETASRACSELMRRGALGEMQGCGPLDRAALEALAGS